MTLPSVEIEPEQMTGARIEEELFYPSKPDKIKLLLTLIEEDWPDKAIVFSNTKHGCSLIYHWLLADKASRRLAHGGRAAAQTVKDV